MCLVESKTMNRSVGPSTVKNLALALLGTPEGGWLTQYAQLLGLIPWMDMSIPASADGTRATIGDPTFADSEGGHLPLSKFGHLLVRQNISSISPDEPVTFDRILSKQTVTCAWDGRLLHNEGVQRFHRVDGRATIRAFSLPAFSRNTLAAILLADAMATTNVAFAVREAVGTIRRTLAGFSACGLVDPAWAESCAGALVIADKYSRLVFTGSEISVLLRSEVNEHVGKVGRCLREAVPHSIGKDSPESDTGLGCL